MMPCKNEKGELVSIIIPVYNTPQQYINECLESVLAQTYKNIEIIVVDDGSDKITAEYLKNFEKKVRILRKKQGGVSSARNYGVLNAKGKYICFVDSDDIIAPGFVECLYNGMIKYAVLISACELKKTKHPKSDMDLQHITYTKYEGNSIWKNINTGYCVTKMFHYSIFSKISFDESISMCEDALFVNYALETCQACCSTNEILYFYRDNPLSSSKLANSAKYLQAISVSKRIQSIEIVKSCKEVLEQFKCFEAIWQFKYMLALAKENLPNSNIYIKESQKNFKKNLLTYTKNTKDKRLIIINILVTFPYGLFNMILKITSLIIRKRK